MGDAVEMTIRATAGGRDAPIRTTTGRVGCGIGAVFFLVFGAWAFWAPSSFHDQVAAWSPYNEHLIRDAGAFQLGIGVALAALLVGIRGTLAALGGAAAGAVLHVISHVIDFGEGGRSGDPYVLAVLAVVLIVALVAEGRSAT
jgi:peptidoglycan/LPS O-acetylase OafA/YrhL